ncbi:hypothetical protein M409DRAFT_49708 [Zasmidium cellare ATCC 36951]|uniref:Uncharacterized protein n=1 Tax=Zasmidium cellare ATCC 36951 TaxID=1080233 RepID=A0A6A6D233_ZASCE|nr:uncharacterized protein M409DRAFT_49708 [Zasmidium cellare ATCC 36951]KAF2173235.1 hypothetical protein M409DRAFT_49708 [Zasmidium cellare ATCC 36951]
MAASLRILYAGKKLRYLTTLNAVARDASNNERRTNWQRNHSWSQDADSTPQPQSLEDVPSKLRLHAIGYEDKQQTQDKPKPAHPGEYVTAWGDFRPQPSSSKGQTKSPTCKSTSRTASLLFYLPEGLGWGMHPYHLRPQKLFTSPIMQASRKHLVVSSICTAAGMSKEMEGALKSAMVSALSSKYSKVLEEANVGCL